MDVSFHCIHCGQKIEADSSLANVAAKCPKCGKDIQIPSSPSFNNVININTAPPPYTYPPIDPRKTNPFAIASLVCGILVPLALLAIIFGHISLNQINKNPQTQKGTGMAKWGLVLGYIFFAAAVIGNMK